MRHIASRLINPLLKIKAVKFRFATQTKNVFTLPKRQNIYPAALSEVSCAIDESYTVRMLSYLFRDNIKFFTDQHVASIYEHIVHSKLQIDDTLYSIIVPITIEYVNTFTIQNGTSLGQIATCAAKLNIAHDKFWESIFNKLDTQNIYKYLTLQQTISLLHALVVNGTYINHNLVTKLSQVVAKQKAFYQNFPELLQLIRQTNNIIRQKGPKTLEITEAYQQIA